MSSTSTIPVRFPSVYLSEYNSPVAASDPPDHGRIWRTRTLDQLHRDYFELRRALGLQVDDLSLQHYNVVPEKKQPNSMIQGKNITINGGKLTNVGGDYHEHNTTYVGEESTRCAKYLKLILDTIKRLETHFTSPKQDNMTSDDSKQTMQNSLLHPPHATKSDDSEQTLQDSPPLPHPRQEVMVDEIRFNSLNDPPQPTSEFDDGYCIYQTSTPTRTNTFASNSATVSATAHNSPSETQDSHPFGRAPGLVPGIMHHIPCWLPTWGGWIASTAWIVHPPCVWPSFL